MEQASKNRLKLLVSFLLITSVIWISSIYCLINSHMLINDIYLPAGKGGIWNDELFYYKQIEAMVKYGYPQGYFGYSLTHARDLSFGEWSVFLLIPYAIIGKMFGWTLITPIICNIFFVTVALSVFALLVRPTNRQMYFIICIIAFFPLMIRYIVSA